MNRLKKENKKTRLPTTQHPMTWKQKKNSKSMFPPLSLDPYGTSPLFEEILEDMVTRHHCTATQTHVAL